MFLSEPVLIKTTRTNTEVVTAAWTADKTKSASQTITLMQTILNEPSLLSVNRSVIFAELLLCCTEKVENTFTDTDCIYAKLGYD